jgi:hypothetical protein
LNESRPLPQGGQNAILQLRLRILEIFRTPEYAVVLANIKVKLVAFTAHEDHRQAKSVREASFEGTTPFGLIDEASLTNLTAYTS